MKRSLRPSPKCHQYGKAAEQGGVLSGDNPVNWLPTDPFRLWVIQLVIIVAMTQFLALFLNRMRQPRVIAEVIGGILLGPTVMGRIPGFKDKIFPDASLAGLNLTSTIGLILFLFLVGLEIDTKVIRRNVFAASSISIAGLLVPLGLGAALGVGLYKEFIDPGVNFGYFLLFTAVAIGITAFPVLCRILTELKLLDTNVGVVTLAAGVGNDVVGWILLALTVALVNASTGLTALYVLLVCVGYTVVLLYPGRWAYVWLAKWTGSLEQGTPTASMMTLTLLVVFVSAFFTDIIGVHAIFGGFLAGLIIPHENGYAISLVEKLEDLVSIIFLPIYFTLSGLKTNLGFLNNGVTWGYTIIICLVAFFSKFAACYAAATATGFNWRESGAIGSLMSCKGLVELIVLNIGLQAKILDPRTFSMFVVHALILTFITTPLTLFFYPAKYRTRHTVDHGQQIAEGGTGPRHPPDDEVKTRFALVLDKIEQLPAAMTISQLLQSDKNLALTSTLSSTDEKYESEKSLERAPALPVVGSRRIAINALRLIELTSRTSAVLKSKVAESLIYNDPVISVFRTFGYLNNLLVSAALSVVNHDEFPAAIAQHVMESESQMVILPWSRGSTTVESDVGPLGSLNPFDGVFQKTTTHDQTSSAVYSELIRNVFSTSPSHVALFVDRGLSTPYSGTKNQHLFMPFFGGPDDRLALAFVVQLCRNPSVQATVVRIRKIDDLSRTSSHVDEKGNPVAIAPTTPVSVILHQTIAAADTVYAPDNTQTRLASDTADNLTWDRYASPSTAHDAETALAISRIAFSTVSSAKPLHTTVELVAKEASSQSTPAGKNMIVVVGRSRRMAVESHKAELQQVVAGAGASIGSSVPKTLGDVGAALVASSAAASLLILQAANPAAA
ncbi:putative potassium hydrogen antiporter [Lyophyllum shimeji]|uniref:Potassium hydrogen antiporter n=1 Tax=Lyophyllum shimeji TaxID=47721 RepID=A0A9P3PDU8_LYOSH|nr:putative potassium hydrogen antiporter [Lyophyllum shimeji]